MNRSRERGPLLGKAVDVRGFQIRMAACPELIPSQIIDHHE
jgi:hypothetical protein